MIDPTEWDGDELPPPIYLQPDDEGVDIPESGELDLAEYGLIHVDPLDELYDDNGLLPPAFSCGTHLPHICPHCFAWRCTIWSVEHGGACCFCGLRLPMP